MSTNAAQRKEFYAALKSEFPNISDDHLNLTLDVYYKDPSVIHKVFKEARKGFKGDPESLITHQMTTSKLDALGEQFKIEMDNKQVIDAINKEHPNDLVIVEVDSE